VDQPVRFQSAQLQGQHALGDTWQLALRRQVAQRVSHQMLQRHSFHLPTMGSTGVVTVQPRAQLLLRARLILKIEQGSIQKGYFYSFYTYLSIEKRFSVLLRHQVVRRPAKFSALVYSRMFLANL